MTYDLLLSNARVIDGTGAPWFRGSIAVEDGAITELFRRSNPDVNATTTVDVDESIVCPGFIDSHSHSDLQVFEDPTLEPKTRQGITTEILGQDGFSMAPMYREGGAQEWERHLQVLAGETNVDWRWGSVDSYFDMIEEHGTAANVGLLVGHGTVRYNVLGMADRDPNADELAEMADLVTEALKDGALGLSTGLVYPPQVNAETDEVAALAARLQPFGRPFVAHIRSEGRWLWEALDEFVDVGANASVPLHLSHYKVFGRDQQGKAERANHLIEAARERDIDFTADQYPYTAGNTRLLSILPSWVGSGAPDEVISRLEDPQARERMSREIRDDSIDGWENTAAQIGWENVIVAGLDSAAYTEFEGESVETIANCTGTTPTEAVCDLLIAEQLNAMMIVHGMVESDVRSILMNERVAVASDGILGRNPHPRTYGTFPRVLGHYVREKNLLTLEEAIRKMTSLPSRILGLEAKGILREEMDADLVVFDPLTISSPADYDSPTQPPTGIQHVIVDGEFIVGDEEVTGRTPGKVIKA